MIHAILDIQHAGRPDKPGDMGAAYDLDGDGVTGENGEREVDLVRAYVARAAEVLRTNGHKVTILESGTYGQRHATAIRIAQADPNVRHVYLACHVNAGGGSYGLLRPDARSADGRFYAIVMVAKLEDNFPELTGVQVTPLYANAEAARKAGRDVSDAGKVAWWTRGYGCIDGIYSGPSNLCAVLVEPGFIDSKRHAPLWTPGGLKRLGEALALAVMDAA